MTMIVFTFIFGTFAHVPSQGLPYPVFSYSGILPWTYFASALGAASGSLAMNSSLVTKIYFPRILLPLAAITVPAVDFILATSVLFGLMAYYSLSVGPHVLLAPVFMVLAAATALGRRPDVLRDQRPLSGRAVRDPLHHPDLALPVAGDLSDQGAPPAVGATAPRSTR